MVTLEEWKAKLIDIIKDTFYTKAEINQKENNINSLINNKLDVDDLIVTINNKNNIQNDGIYMYEENE